ncbi:MAG: 50S ribosomal protein L35 [Candidatus Margulisbacteria bacterium]|jgi:large subunit ribosomal protein L35|nr:50S ribosomal protein L35 [Candidatus Margulisiibacteriota bacterium]
MKNKLKTRKSAAKRIKVTGTGKYLRNSAGMRHLLEHESSEKKRNKGNSTEVSPSDARKVKLMLPYQA